MTVNNQTPRVVAKKSYKEGHVAIRVTLKSGGWRGDAVKVEGGTDMPVNQARELARSIIELCDQADAKSAAKAASDERRRKYREREIAAGRMVVLGGLP